MHQEVIDNFESIHGALLRMNRFIYGVRGIMHFINTNIKDYQEKKKTYEKTYVFSYALLLCKALADYWYLSSPHCQTMGIFGI